MSAPRGEMLLGTGHDFRDEKEQGAMSTEIFGEVIYWSAGRGFGFLKRSDGQRDLFIHIRNVNPPRRYASLAIGQSVRFEIGKNPNNDRTCAVNVELIEPIISPEAIPFHRDDDGGPKPIADMPFMRQ
jgi:cold shock CspA family protein